MEEKLNVYIIIIIAVIVFLLVFIPLVLGVIPEPDELIIECYKNGTIVFENKTTIWISNYGFGI